MYREITTAPNGRQSVTNICFRGWFPLETARQPAPSLRYRPDTIRYRQRCTAPVCHPPRLPSRVDTGGRTSRFKDSDSVRPSQQKPVSKKIVGRCDSIVALLTPVFKNVCSDSPFELISILNILHPAKPFERSKPGDVGEGCAPERGRFFEISKLQSGNLSSLCVEKQ